MSKIIHINNKEDFNREVITKSETVPVMVDFWAGWCAPCKAMNPILEEFAENHPEIVVVKVDVEDDEGISTHYDISSIPTILLFMNQGTKNRIIGAKSYSSLESEITSKIKKGEKKSI